MSDDILVLNNVESAYGPIKAIRGVSLQVRQGAVPPHEFVALSHLLHDLRLYKTRNELRVMKKSAMAAPTAASVVPMVSPT